MKKIQSLLALLLVIAIFPLTSYANSREDLIHVTLLYFNDVYEITPVSGGKEGGLARVATIRKALLKKNPNTITLMGGDFFNPSAMGTAKVNGEALAGKQMVDVLNTLGLQYATFGNHEFDIKENQFNQRMSEAKFTWISSNVFDANGHAYPGVKKDLILPFTDKKSGKTFKIGIFGVTLTVNKPSYVSYTDPAQTADTEVKSLKGKSDFLIALTHQSLDDDVTLLQKQASIDLLLGGHEHVNYQQWRGNNLAPLLKADGNARSVYVVELYFNPKTGKTKIQPNFVLVNDLIAEDPQVNKVVTKWKTLVFDAFRKQGLNPDEVITNANEALDGLESSVRFRQTNLTKLTAVSMLQPYPEADISLYNSGTIRIDDILPAGPITGYDIIRVMPFGGLVELVEMKGRLLQKVLAQGDANIGSGGYLQSANTAKLANGGWLVKGADIDPNKIYKVAILDFLMSGRESNLAYLNASNPDIKVLNNGTGSDIRQLVINQLRRGAK
ncbi:MAG: bifunctional metallophosphatase/5'-nucleotidase [Gallionellaceae bacterium]